MKRVLLHLGFWIAYLSQDVLLHFSWMAPSLARIPEDVQFQMALQTAFIIAIPKVLLVYYCLFVGLPRILRDRSNMVLTIIELTLVTALSVILFRVLFHFYINPYVYRGILKVTPLFSLRSITVAIMEIGFVTGVAIALKLLTIQISGKEREKNLIKDKLETELKFLRNQTNPHFLFNTLNNIYALARKKSDNTADVVMKLSKILRFMLYESGKGSITIIDEVRLMEDYLELEKIRYNERLTVKFNIEIDNAAQRVAPLLLLPFIENAFKHGVSETRFDSSVDIDLNLKKDILNFTVENTKENGHGNGSIEKIGLANVKRQLELMYRDYNLDVLSYDDTFKVFLTINLNSHAKM